MRLLKIKNILWDIARHHHLLFMILLALALAWGGFLFFDNFLPLKGLDLGTVSPKPVFDQELYQEVSGILEARAEKLEQIESKTYLSPFQEATSTEN